MLKEWVRTKLACPLTQGMDIDDPHTTELRREIIRAKPFLRRIYEEWYASLAGAMPAGPGAVLELGSGAGFFKEFEPHVITSEIFHCEGVLAVLDAHQLPFAAASLRGIVMTDVLHHLPQPRRFFAEAIRCLRPGGVVTMVEPWVSSWSQRVYRSLHHEPFEPYANSWEFPSSGPLSGANGAMPWIIFHRDRGQFELEFPQLKIRLIQPMMPFRYLVSGGVSMRALVPNWSFSSWRAMETLLRPIMNQLAMFVRIELERT